MKLKLALIAAAALAGSALAPGISAPAEARTIMLRPTSPAVAAGAGYYRPGYRPGWNRPYYGRGGYYGHRRGYGYGPALGGFAAGAILGGALGAAAAAPPAYYPAAPGGDAVAYCMQRFKSYDPASGTYLGYDGLRHPCP